MSRIPPKPSTVKSLFALSGNICASPDCNSKLIEDSVVIGQICHIEAAEEGGPRYNEDSNDEYRRSFDNLFLLCSICHKKIDNDVTTYETTLLRQWKTSHENNYKSDNYAVTDEIVEESISNYIEQNNINLGSGTQIINQSSTQNIKEQIGTKIIITDKEKDKPIEGKYRKVNPTLKKAIDTLRQDASPPTEDVIDFRNNLLDKRKSQIYNIPVKDLKFRKENGRIKAEVESYEKTTAIIDENSKEGQELLKGFLNKSDPEKKEILKQQIKHKGQLHPAIITCDGFLINGNRRKMIFEVLYEESHKDAKYEEMRVIILPEHVSEFDIKRIENRYQLQDEGKSEYHGLNRALTLRDNEKDGYTLEAQILDDPQYADKTGKELEKVVKDFKSKFLNPLTCVDRYLTTFNRQGLYNTISEGAGDKEGRWQAFIDYSSFYNSTLDNPSKRNELGIKESEVRTIENAIFKIIRKRNLDSEEIEKALGKLHSFVRGGNLKKYLDSSKTDAKKYFIKIAQDVEEDIPDEHKYNSQGEKFSERIIDEKWGVINKKNILSNLMQAHKVVHNKSERDKPLDLLTDALKKLNHDNLKIENLGTEHYKKALELTKKISGKAESIYSEIDHARGNLRKLRKKK